MSKELALWKFIASHLMEGEEVMLLIVATSSGSSPGRAGYKMAVAADGQLCGSIGGGLMEVNLVEQSRAGLSEPGATGLLHATLTEQVHQKNSVNSSGMICSGKQSIILKQLSVADADTVSSIACGLSEQTSVAFEISNLQFQIVETANHNSGRSFSKTSETDFVYRETLGHRNELYIIGGGHCSLALSELMSKLDFHIRIFDDRPELNTIAKNEFADEVTIVDSYESIGEYVEKGEQIYVVVMTLGYASDAVVIRALADRQLRYFGVLGSMAKMTALMKELRSERIDEKLLSRIRTPIGVPINSQTPEEIAISIAAEIISVKNT